MKAENNGKAARTRQAVKLYEAGLGTYQIGQKLGLSQPTVWRILRLQGVEMRPKGRPKDEERSNEAARLYLSGLTMEKVGDQLGITRQRVQQLLSGMGVLARSPTGRHGVPRPDVTIEKVVELRRQGLPVHKIGMILGCGHRLVMLRLKEAPPIELVPCPHCGGSGRVGR